MKDIRRAYRERWFQKGRELGFTDSEIDKMERLLHCLCCFVPAVSPSYFDPEREMKELFQNDRALFGRFFYAAVHDLGCLSALREEEIPIGREFEDFPRFIDLVHFFLEK
ncbi:hypothetical protein IMZ31_22660 (plasmid) [Pontibacillus sp. ALD_SL1]|uniref:hypothetical protein n=1 Tax=Pontibacillus sp. ALD_SL1 TaxID=2777185 RepID=UPI001A9597FC|nr:hypothetical protein [Pontibacillus sp. ALD_SL1]QST02259.1 hypothetical protein IMZ31_22660 [Pontibacillus sp. ALD_SL1]